MAFSDITGLLGLAQSTGVDVRPTLLRVVTDLFAQRRIRSTDAARQYIHLTLQLLDAASLEARQAVAAKLAQDPLAPLQIIERLARDELAVAAPVLRYSPRLTRDALKAIATEFGPDYAAVIATRDHAAVARADQRDATAATPDDAGAAELCELFFAANGAERRLILMNFDHAAPAGSRERVPAPPQDAAARLEVAALQGDQDGFARELERALGISAGNARRIAADPSGEPIVVVARALRLPTDVLHRILLFLNPAVGHSVERVYALATLHDEITPEAARSLVTIWRDADPRQQTSRARPGREAGDRLDPRSMRRATPQGLPGSAVSRRAGEG